MNAIETISLILIGAIIVFFFLKKINSPKKTKTSAPSKGKVKKPAEATEEHRNQEHDQHTSHGHSDDPEHPPVRWKTWAWTILFIVLGFLAILMIINLLSSSKEKEPPIDYLPSQEEGPALKLVGSKIIDPNGPDSVWVTPAIGPNSEFKFWSSTEHSFNVQFSSSTDERWTKKVLISAGDQKDGILDSAPGATPGRARVTIGPKETKPYEVRLYMN